MTGHEFFDKLNKDTMNLVDDFYAPNAILVDPVGEHKGSAAIKAYYTHQYANVKSIRWEFKPDIKDKDNEVLRWTMFVSHPNIEGGKEIKVDGASVIEFKDGKAVYHRDYFDMGEFVYERVPVLGFIVSKIKNMLKAPTP